MYLHKTGAADKPEPPVRNEVKAPSSQAAKTSAPQTSTPHAGAAASNAGTAAANASPRSAFALAAAAGLPVDKLSASIVVFSRFFSLPLKPELLAAIRRQSLAPSPSAMPSSAAENAATAKDAADSGVAAKIREALSLAAAAAESKGVELQPKALEAFAEAIDPDWRKRENSGGGDQRGRQNKDRPQQEEENAAGKTSPITAAVLKEIALNAVEQNPLLALLNRLPGKNGQRWIVLPFSFEDSGREFTVSLRILLEGEQAPSTGRTGGMAVAYAAIDIAESGASGSPETGRRWLFALEAPNHTHSSIVDRPSANRLSVYFQPELPLQNHAAYKRELSALLGIPLARISIKNSAEAFPSEASRADELLRSINEAV